MSEESQEFEVEVPAFEPVPIDGIDLRDAIASDYQQVATGTLERQDAEKLAVSDLQLVDSHERDRPEPQPHVWPDAAEPVAEYEQAKTAAAEQGGTFEKRVPAPDHDPETLGDINLLRRQALVKRINLLMGITDGQHHYPRYMVQLRDEWIDWNFRRRLYRWVWTQQQRDRIYFRRLEDIADRSNGHPHLPNWWVK